MIHFVKIILEHSDIFVRAIDLQSLRITFQVFDKEGHPMGALVVDDNMFPIKGVLMYDKNRPMDIQQAMYCDHLLNGTEYELAPVSAPNSVPL